MNKNFALTKLAGAVLLGLLTTSCARFSERTQAEGKYDYEKVTLRESDYDSGDFTRHEARSVYEIAELSEQQKHFGLAGKELDVRPPSQLMPVIEGILLDADPTQTKISFNAFVDNESIQEKVWQLLLNYLSDKGAEQANVNQSTLTIDTGPIIRNQVYGSLSKNYVQDTAEYQLTLSQSKDKHNMSLLVDVTKYQELNDNKEVIQLLEGRTKRSIEIRFINDLLEYAYHERISKQQKIVDDSPLPITLGFDDNHQTAWLIDSGFSNTWEKLPDLLRLMSFVAVQDNQNLGYFLVNFEPQAEKYWTDNNLNPIDLPSGEYFVQLGELAGGSTSIIWLDSNKKPLTDQQVTDLYLSITDKVRNVILKNEDKPKPL